MAPRPLSTVLPEARGAPSAPQGGLGPLPTPPGTRALPLSWVPVPRAETRSFPLTRSTTRLCRAGPVPPASFSTAAFPLPSVSGEWVTEGGRSHTSWPASTSAFLLPLAEAVELPGEPARAPRSPGGVQQVRLAGIRPQTSSNRAWRWCACPRAGRPGSGGWEWGWGGGGKRKRRRRTESLARSRAAGWRPAQRQVRPPGERAPRVPPSVVGRAGLQ